MGGNAGERVGKESRERDESMPLDFFVFCTRKARHIIEPFRRVYGNKPLQRSAKRVLRVGIYSRESVIFTGSQG